MDTWYLVEVQAQTAFSGYPSSHNAPAKMKYTPNATFAAIFHVINHHKWSVILPFISKPTSFTKQCSTNLAVISWEAPFPAPQLAFPPVVRTVGLLDDLDAVALLETQITC